MKKYLIVVASIFMMAVCSHAIAVTVSTDSVRMRNSTYSLPGSDSCAYFAEDTYSGELPGGGITYFRSPPYGSNNFGGGQAPPYPPQTGPASPLNLAWSGGNNSAFATAVPCGGKFAIYFTLQVEATDNNSPVNIMPCVQTTSGRVLYGTCSNTSPIVVNFNPSCNGGDYCGTMIFNFTAQVNLNQGEMLQAPIIYTDGKIVITGGEFITYFMGP